MIRELVNVTSLLVSLMWHDRPWGVAVTQAGWCWLPYTRWGEKAPGVCSKRWIRTVQTLLPVPVAPAIPPRGSRLEGRRTWRMSLSHRLRSRSHCQHLRRRGRGWRRWGNSSSHPGARSKGVVWISPGPRRTTAGTRCVGCIPSPPRWWWQGWSSDSVSSAAGQSLCPLCLLFLFFLCFLRTMLSPFHLVRQPLF